MRDQCVAPPDVTRACVGNTLFSQASSTPYARLIHRAIVLSAQSSQHNSKSRRSLCLGCSIRNHPSRRFNIMKHVRAGVIQLGSFSPLSAAKNMQEQFIITILVTQAGGMQLGSRASPSYSVGMIDPLLFDPFLSLCQLLEHRFLPRGQVKRHVCK
jgi:hypothetical protein